MKTLFVTLRTITPLFLGGPDQNRCELRPPSIKGALRFWFRFIEGARCPGGWEQVREKEGHIFGGTNDNEGQSSFKVRLDKPILGESFEICKLDGLRYLGYGLYKGGGNEWRDCIPPKREFTFSLLFNETNQVNANMQAVYEALWLWTHLGGFGSRSRRGWGSLELCKTDPVLEPYPITGKPDGLSDRIKSGLEEMVPLTQRPTEGEYSHLIRDVRIVCPFEKQYASECLDELGQKLNSYRSYRKKKNFEPDHALVDNYLQGNGIDRAPDRVIFGLPHNYFFSSRMNKNLPPEMATFAPRVAGQSESRRASPLFMRVHRLSEVSYAAILMLVPVKFLSGKIVVHADSKDKDRSTWKRPTGGDQSQDPWPDQPVDPPSQYWKIQDFLNSLGGNRRVP